MRQMKQVICGIVLRVLFRAVRVLSRCDSRVREELRNLPDGLTVRFSVSPRENSRKLNFTVSDGTVRRTESEPDIHITFKSETMAFRVFTGRMGIAAAYAAHAFWLKGNINQAMGVVRVVNLVEAYLFPKIISRRILTDVPKKQKPALLVYLRLIPGK